MSSILVFDPDKIRYPGIEDIVKTIFLPSIDKTIVPEDARLMTQYSLLLAKNNHDAELVMLYNYAEMDKTMPAIVKNIFINSSNVPVVIIGPEKYNYYVSLIKNGSNNKNNNGCNNGNSIGFDEANLNSLSVLNMYRPRNSYNSIFIDNTIFHIAKIIEHNKGFDYSPTLDIKASVGEIRYVLGDDKIHMQILTTKGYMSLCDNENPAYLTGQFKKDEVCHKCNFAKKLVKARLNENVFAAAGLEYAVYVLRDNGLIIEGNAVGESNFTIYALDEKGSVHKTLQYHINPNLLVNKTFTLHKEGHKEYEFSKPIKSNNHPQPGLGF